MDEKDFSELMESVRDLKAYMRGEDVPVRITHVPDPEPQAIRERMRLSQAEFAALLGISPRTLQNWEQGHRRPTGPAMQLLRVADKHPEAVLDAVMPHEDP